MKKSDNGNGTGRVALRVMESEIEAIRRASISVSGLPFQELSDRLTAMTGKIVVTGVGKSAIAARKIAATLATCSVQSVFVDPIGLFHGELGLLVSGDLVLLISQSGETSELIQLLEPLEKKGCLLFAMCGRLESTIAKRSRTIPTGTLVEPFLKVPTASSAAAVALGDALAIEVATRKGFDVNAFALNHPGGHIGVVLRESLAKS